MSATSRKADDQNPESTMEGLPAVVNTKHQAELARSSMHEIARMQDAWFFGRSDLEDRRIIYPEMEEKDITDAFRRIRTKILQKSQSSNQVVLVAGLEEGNGASFVTNNIAAAFAFDESKTALLLDCDIKNPGISFRNNQVSTAGLIEYLEGDEEREIGVEEIIHPSGIRRLRIVPVGDEREDSVEYFTSMKMRHLIETVKARYSERYIFLNSPPVLKSADAEILVELCDYVVLVVPYGKYTEARIAEAAKAIGKEKLLGVVFNNQPRIPSNLSIRSMMPWKNIKSIFSKRRNQSEDSEDKNHTESLESNQESNS